MPVMVNASFSLRLLSHTIYNNEQSCVSTETESIHVSTAWRQAGGFVCTTGVRVCVKTLIGPAYVSGCVSFSPGFTG